MYACAADPDLLVAVVFTVDATTSLAHPPNSSEEIAEGARPRQIFAGFEKRWKRLCECRRPAPVPA